MMALTGVSIASSILLLFVTLLLLFITPAFFFVGSRLGRHIRGRHPHARAWILGDDHPQSAGGEHATEGADDWRGIVAFFHPFANAGGGGERVLWQAVRATQHRWPRARCVIYTSDSSQDQPTLVRHVRDRFEIELDGDRLRLLYLNTQSWLQPESYPRLTLLGQSLGSLRTGWEALGLCVPDVFVDTVGFAFVTAMVGWLMPDVRTVAYVHYPTISTDMLDALGADDDQSGQERGLNAGRGRGIRGMPKRLYWTAFARLYGAMGGSIHLVYANSSWTKGHLDRLWGKSRRGDATDPTRSDGRTPGRVAEIRRLYPPCNVSSLLSACQLDEASEQDRLPIILSLAQFRPEKNHPLLLRSFAKLLSTSDLPKTLLGGLRLTLIGSVRNSADAKRVYDLRLLTRELKLESRVEFVVDADWAEVRARLARSSVGVNTMWNEHFGIGVVEYMAAGLVPVVHGSGGPRMDILDPEQRSGLFATTEAEFADAFAKVLSLDVADRVGMRRLARERSRLFGEDVFERGWVEGLEEILAVQPRPG